MITDDLGSLIQQGYNSIGELEFVAAPPGFRLFHTENKNSLGGARVFRRLTDARELAKYDRIGKYRPLKGAPNLPSDWVLELPDLDSLKEALNLFYPGAVGTLLAYRRGETKDIPFRRHVSNHPKNNNHGSRGIGSLTLQVRRKLSAHNFMEGGAKPIRKLSSRFKVGSRI
jgi:hypothetical protein